MCSPRIFAGLAGVGGLDLPVAVVPWLEWAGPHDMATLGSKVAEQAAALGPVILVGHSTGGVIALSAALRARPGTVAGIVLCATGANMHGHGDVDVIIERVSRDWGPALWEQVVRRSVHLEMACGHSPPAELPGQFNAIGSGCTSWSKPRFKATAAP